MTDAIKTQKRIPGEQSRGRQFREKQFREAQNEERQSRERQNRERELREKRVREKKIRERQIREKRILDMQRKKQQRVQTCLAILAISVIILLLVVNVDLWRRLKKVEATLEAAGWGTTIPMEDLIPLIGEGEENAEEAGAIAGADLGNIPEYARACELGELEKPMKREGSQLLKKLRELGEENEKIALIAEDSHLYPEDLLEALANNPEMTDFVEGYLNQPPIRETGLTEEELQMEYPLFLQWDPRWGYDSYGYDSNIAVSGCGPTSLSMVLYYLTRNELFTPGNVAEYAMENDYYLKGTGTMWSLMDEAPLEFGVKSEMLLTDELEMKQALDQEKILICSVRPGDFTAGGHFIVLYGYNEDGFLVNDPNCVERSRREWSFERMQDQIKQVWAFSK